MVMIAKLALCEAIMLALVLFLYRFISLVDHVRCGPPAPTNNVESNVDSLLLWPDGAFCPKEYSISIVHASFRSQLSERRTISISVRELLDFCEMLYHSYREGCF